MVDVVTVWAPRPSNPKWRDDYLDLLSLQRRSCERVGHRHVVMTDAELPGYDTIKVQMRESLMFAILEGQIAYVEQWNNRHPFVLVDMDCIVVRKLDVIFAAYFHVLLTKRDSPVSPIQNGAMYFNAGAKDHALKFLRRALELCKDHWGGDQEAISQAVAPVPEHSGEQSRFGGRFQFESTAVHNHSPRDAVPKIHGRYIMHFKGESKKFAAEFAAMLFRSPVL